MHCIRQLPQPWVWAHHQQPACACALPAGPQKQAASTALAWWSSAEKACPVSSPPARVTKDKSSSERHQKKEYTEGAQVMQESAAPICQRGHRHECRIHEETLLSRNGLPKGTFSALFGPGYGTKGWPRLWHKRLAQAMAQSQVAKQELAVLSYGKTHLFRSHTILLRCSLTCRGLTGTPALGALLLQGQPCRPVK